MKPLILAIVPTIMQCQMNKKLRVEVKNRIVPLKVSIPIVKEKFQNRQIQALCSVSILIRDKTLNQEILAVVQLSMGKFQYRLIQAL